MNTSYKEGRAIRTYNIMCSVVKLIFLGVLNQSQKTNHLKFIKPPKCLIEVLSTEEITAIINNTNNLKHKAVIATLYHTACRVSEFINLKRKDISSEKIEGKRYYKINIINGKGGKGRSIPIPYELAKLISDYIAKHDPKEYLFEGDKGKYSKSSISKILKQNYKGRKRIYPHLLRHSCATHLVDIGIQIAKLQKLLGHTSLKSTMIYVHLSNRSLNDIKRPTVILLKDKLAA